VHPSECRLIPYCKDAKKLTKQNSLSFAVGYGITPWLDLGLQNTFISAAMVGMAVYASFLIVIKYGKSWRSQSRVAYWAIVMNGGEGAEM
jgi:hypothetical protein